MENTWTEEESESSFTGIFKLPGEPAVVINGLPPMTPQNGDIVPCDVVTNNEKHRNTCFAEWLEGREVRKLFGEQFYNGKVTEFDKETGWYRVVYEDRDFEDLEWHELEKILLPLDITVPLKSLAMKIIKRKEKVIRKSDRTGSTSSNRLKSDRGRGRPKGSTKRVS